MSCLLEVPLLPLYMRGAGLQERFPNWLRVGVLIGYNYISSCTRKIGSIPTPLEASCSLARQTVPMGSAWYSVGPTHPVQAGALWTSSWVSWDNIPTMASGVSVLPVLGRLLQDFFFGPVVA